MTTAKTPLAAAKVCSNKPMEPRVHEILDSISDGFFAVDKEWRLIYLNPAAERMLARQSLHVPHQDLVGKNLWEVFPAPEGGVLHRQFHEAMSQFRTVEFEGYLAPFDLCLNIHTYPFAGGLAFYFHDVKERKQTLEALRRSEERLQLAQQVGGIGSFEWDIISGTIHWSAELDCVYGMDPGSFGGRLEDWMHYVHDEDRARVRQELREAAEQGTELASQFRIVWADGSTHWLAARAQVFRNEDEAPARMIGVNIDISERKQAEEALHSAEKLATAGRMAASIAHEINNPLEAVINLLYLIKLQPRLAPKTREYIGMAESELARVTHITRQTLAFYRESARVAPFSIVSLVDDIVELYARRMEHKSVRLERRHEGDGTVVGKAGEIRQVISNLVTNAIDAVREGGSLRIHTVNGRDWRNPEREGIRIYLADNGPGITAAVRRQIFEPFFTTKNSGTGLGLWVSAGIVQKHGGSIHLHSTTRPGRSGSVFSIFLPNQPEGGQDEQAA